jgi:diphosphomevalonate decarboxylase
VNARALRVRTHPSLALIKYWGKRRRGINIPASPSLAVTLDALHSDTEIHPGSGGMRIELDGSPVDPERYAPFLQRLEKLAGHAVSLTISSRNSFPSSAGLASSSSGYAALALGCCAALGLDLPLQEISALARIGSGSAARAVYPGFTVLRAGSSRAEALRGADFWPGLRVGLGIVSPYAKKTSSRDGMNEARRSSPYYRAWLDNSRVVMQKAEAAFLRRDLEELGSLMRLSYLRMFSTMLSSAPPLIYWKPETLALIHALEELRARGVSVWETMDAGPQVKFLCEEDDMQTVLHALSEAVPAVSWLSAAPGGEPRIEFIASPVEEA